MAVALDYEPFVLAPRAGAAEPLSGVQEEILELRSSLGFPRLKGALAELIAGYPGRYRAPLP